jgi:hypothetical protein
MTVRAPVRLEFNGQACRVQKPLSGGPRVLVNDTTEAITALDIIRATRGP